MPKAKPKGPLSLDQWWGEVQSGKRSYKKPADSDKAIGALKNRGWKESDCKRAKVLMEAFFRDPSTAPKTFHGESPKSGETAAIITRTLKAAGKAPAKVQAAAPAPGLMQELAAQFLILQSRKVILEAMLIARSIDGVDTSEMQSVINDLSIDAERLRVLNDRAQGVPSAPPAPVGKRTPVTKNVAPPPPVEETVVAPEPPPLENNGGTRRPKAFSGTFTEPTQHQREVFEKTRPKS